MIKTLKFAAQFKDPPKEQTEEIKVNLDYVKSESPDPIKLFESGRIEVQEEEKREDYGRWNEPCQALRERRKERLLEAREERQSGEETGR